MSDEKTAAEPSGASGGSLAWIPVAERLPQPESRCLIWERIANPEMAMEFASWTGDRWKTHGAISSILHPSMVSHWMPLPEPPTGAK